MKFLFSPVTSFEDVTRNFEQLQAAKLGMAAGMISPFAGAIPPAGALAADGSVYPPSTYPALFAAIGTTYGGTAGSPLLPNIPAGTNIVQQGGGFALAATGGEQSHTLATGEMPSHNHGGSTGTGSTGTGSTGTGSTGTGSTGTGSTGTGSTGTGLTGANATLADNTGTESAGHNHNVPTVGITYQIGGSGGAFPFTAGGTNTLTGAENQLHTHAIPPLGIPQLSVPSLSVPSLSVPSLSVGSLSVPALSVPALSVPALSISNQGSGTAHNNMPPWIAMNYVIWTGS